MQQGRGHSTLGGRRLLRLLTREWAATDEARYGGIAQAALEAENLRGRQSGVGDPPAGHINGSLKRQNLSRSGQGGRARTSAQRRGPSSIALA
jgi:hypothetical protein